MPINKPIINVLVQILDDNLDYNKLLNIKFKQLNEFEYRIYSDVDKFISEIGEDHNICVTDYHLKNKYNGIDILSMILEKNSRSCVIMVSSQTDLNIVVEFYDRGGCKYIDKSDPNYFDKMIKVIREAKQKMHDYLDYHFEIIENFNKTQEIFNDARNTLNRLGNNTRPIS